jgi:predicted nicotinamide N-methyase
MRRGSRVLAEVGGLGKPGGGQETVEMDAPRETAPDDRALEEEVRAATVAGRTALVPELELRLLRPGSPLWASFDPEEPAPPPRPYWAFAWVGGLGLARHLLDHPELVAGRTVLDFGAGGGIAGLAAARAGAASVLAADIDPLALAACRLNAAANRLALAVTRRDLRYEDEGWDVVLAADVFYDAYPARHIRAWLGDLAVRGAEVLAADPGRIGWKDRGFDELARYEGRSEPELGPADVVRVFRARPGAAATGGASTPGAIV